MTRRGIRVVEKLPRSYLPDPIPAREAHEWDARVARIMEAAEGELRTLEGNRSDKGADVLSSLGLWWKPASVLMAAAVALLLLLPWSETRLAPAPPALPLSLMAAEGDAQTLWGAFGMEADPVLALITLQASEAAGSNPSNDEGGHEQEDR